MLIDRDALERILRRNGCSYTRAGFEMGLSAQRIEQLCKSRGIKIVKDIIYVEPQAKTLLNPKKEEICKAKSNGNE